MAHFLKQKLVNFAHRLAPDLFEEFAHKYSIAPSTRFALRALASRGLQPRTVIDVGAYEGAWTKMVKEIWPASRVVMVEANQSKIPALKAIGEVRCALLGAEAGREVEFAVMETGSSVFHETSSAPRQIEKRTLVTIDSLDLQIKAPAFLKVDAQGYELEILKGATQTMSQCEAILLEVSLIAINSGAPLLHEVTDFMTSSGFLACDILEAHRRPLDGALWQVDILFARGNAKIRKHASFD